MLKHIDGKGKELEDFFRKHINEHFILGKTRNQWDDNRVKKEWCEMTGCVKPDESGLYNMSNSEEKNIYDNIKPLTEYVMTVECQCQSVLDLTKKKLGKISF